MGYTMTAQQPYSDFNKEKITAQFENLGELVKNTIFVA